MRFPLFFAVLFGIFVSTVFGKPVSKDTLDVNLDTRDVDRATLGGLRKRAVEVDMYEVAFSDISDEQVTVVGVNGCSAVFIWLAGGELVAGHSVPGDHDKVAEDMRELVGDDAVSRIVVVAPDTVEGSNVRTALSGQNFGAPTMRYYPFIEDEDHEWEFVATAGQVGQVTNNQIS